MNAAPRCGSKPRSPRQLCYELSGGNQQKVVFAKALSGRPVVLLLDEPTRGVDVGAKFDIYSLIRELSAEGMAVLIASSDFPELLGMCDRIIVMRGRGHFDGARRWRADRRGFAQSLLRVGRGAGEQAGRCAGRGEPRHLATLLRRYGTLIGFVAILVFFWISLPETFMTGAQLAQHQPAGQHADGRRCVDDHRHGHGRLRPQRRLDGEPCGDRRRHPLHARLSRWAAVAIALLVGLARRRLNGVLVSLIGILPFIATLATLTVFSGAAFLISGGKTIFGRDIPEGFSGFARGGVPSARSAARR